VDYEEIPRNGDERSTLLAFLGWQRATLARKCEGLNADQLRRRSAEPSTLSLLGLVRHMADVELGWFRRTLAGEDVEYHYSSDQPIDAGFDNGDTADVEEAFATWREECAHAAPDLGYALTQGQRASRSLGFLPIHCLSLP